MKPGLTAEEWKLLLNWIREDGPLDPEAVGATFDSHGTAAACLYGQPFGFTRQDVALIRAMLSVWNGMACNQDGEWLYVGDQFSDEQRESLADRIAALLPPEGT